MKVGPETLIRQSFFFGPKQIQAIKTQLEPHVQSRSRFELIFAFLWRLRTKALELDENEVVSLSFPVNLRGKIFPELPNGYYGNAVVSPAAVTTAKALCKNSLGYAVELLSKTKAKLNEDYVKSAIDFMALHGKPGFNTRGAWIVSDASRIGYHKVDFGWGEPVYGGTMDGGSLACNTICSHFRNSAGEDGLLVPICLPVSAMDRLKEELVRELNQIPLEEFRQPKYVMIPSML